MDWINGSLAGVFQFSTGFYIVRLPPSQIYGAGIDPDLEGVPSRPWRMLYYRMRHVLLQTPIAPRTL